MRYKDFVKYTEDVFESIVTNALIVSTNLGKLQAEISTLKRENKMLRDYLNVELYEEAIEGGAKNKFIRKIK